MTSVVVLLAPLVLPGQTSSTNVVPAAVPSVDQSSIPSDEELAKIGRVTPDEAGFSESVAQANNELVIGYKRIRNEF